VLSAANCRHQYTVEMDPANAMRDGIFTISLLAEFLARNMLEDQDSEEFSRL